MAEEDALKIYWEHFFKAETGTYEKSTWLDLFLAEFLIRVRDGAKPKELINFCPISGVVSLVGCELLCGIHRVTSAATAHSALAPPTAPASPAPLAPAASPPAAARDTGDGEPRSPDPRLTAASALTRATAQGASEALRQALLRGGAWRCLALLRAAGVEGMSCCRQLSSVLIWVFGELRGGGGGGGGGSGSGSGAVGSRAAHRTPIHQLFSDKIWAKQKAGGGGGGQPSKGASASTAAASERSSSALRSRLGSPLHQEPESKTKRKTKDELSSDSDRSNADLQVLNRSLAVKVTSKNDDFQYFESPRGPADLPGATLYTDPFRSPRAPKPKASDYMNDKHREIINSEISIFDFTLLIIDLLQELCKTESGLTGSEGSQVSVQCINFALKNVCSLQFGSLPQASLYSSEENSTIKVALTELLIVSLDKVLVYSDLCAKLISNGILPMLLRLLEDIVCKASSQLKEEKGAKDEMSKTESSNLLKFVFGVAYSITAFFHCLLMQCRTVEKLRTFTDQFKLYGECLQGGLIKECIELMVRIPAEHEEVVLLVKKLIESLGKLIAGMKRVRSEVVHAAACQRSRHKTCRQRVAAGMHHHHDILGEAGAGLPIAASCCVSVLYGTLTSLVTDDEVANQSVLRNKILRTMLNSGVCCCFSPGFLMESVVRLMLTHNSVATLCLQVLEHTVYGELGASILARKVSDQLPCSICEPAEDKRDLIRKYCPHGVSPVERKSVWSFLIHYNSLLQLDNHKNVLHATVSHLLRVTPKCCMEMKYELLFSVIYPTFIVAKHRYLIRLEEAAYFLTVACLNIFASLLNTVSFAEQFIQKGGLSYVLELVSISEFSNQCCSILEIAIIVEIFKLIKDNSEMNFYREMSSLASVQMLFKSLAEVTDKCYRIYKIKLPDEKFEELCDIEKERESLGLKEVSHAESAPRKLSSPRAVKAAPTFANTESSDEESVENFLEVLKNVWTFWKSCAGLCLYSPMFRQYVVSEKVFVDSYALLKVLLYYLCNCECSMAEMRILVKIVEALLTVQLAVTDVSSGRSKQTTCAVVRRALGGAVAGVAGGAGGAGLRALCEALIRGSGGRQQPAARHKSTMDLVNEAVPPLGCEPGASSGGSSSEESAAGPYASDRSAGSPRRVGPPDPGYDADIEISKLEFLTLDKSRKISGLSLLNTVSGTGEPLGPWDGPPPAPAPPPPPAELPHPELCIIVVDVLTQLIHKLLTAPPAPAPVPAPAAQASASRATAALARACCVRLAGALSAPRAAPPRLLARLLRPAAAKLLTASDPQLEDLQRSILELIYVVASQSIAPSELAAFLRLFAAERPPLGLLLSTLQRLVNAAQPNTPDCILSFPVDADDKEYQAAGAEEFVVVNSASSQSQQAEAFAQRIEDAHVRAGISSPWSLGAARVGIEGAGWAPWLQGFAVALWLRPAEPGARAVASAPSDTDDWDTADEWPSPPPLAPAPPPAPAPAPAPAAAAAAPLAHVLSVGSESLVLELWLASDGSLTIRLSRPEPGGAKVVGVARVADELPATRWACLALNVTERLIKRRIHIQVTVFVNGCEVETVSIPLQGILVRKASASLVVVGCRRGLGAGAGAGGERGYHLAHAALYRAPVLTVYAAATLAARPHLQCQLRCEAPYYPVILTPEMLDSNIDWDQLFDVSSSALREVQDSLLLTCSAHAPHIMNLYHQTVSIPSALVFGGRVASTAGLTGQGGGASGVAVPEALLARWAGPPRGSSHRGIAPALYLLGGHDIFMYLFARTVELEGSAAEQAAALAVLLRAGRADSRLHAALYEGPALHMLHTVFMCAKCLFTPHMLKVILDEACSSSILSTSGNALVVSARSDAAILEPRLLLMLCKAWRQMHTTQEYTWEVEAPGGSRLQQRGSLWALALCCLRALVREEHPRRGFNQYQGSRLRLLTELLAACKERFLNSSLGPLEGAEVDAGAGAGGADGAALTALVRGLLGSPPAPHGLLQLADFLLLMHQASDTFVTHSRANFYFLLTADTPEASELNILRRKPSRSSRRSRIRTSDAERSSSSMTSDDLGAESSVTASQQAPGEGPARGQVQVEAEAPAPRPETSKLMKGRINMQIKEGRKHNVSSTSENSDFNVEHAGPGQPPPAARAAQATPTPAGGAGLVAAAAAGAGGNDTEGESDTLKEYIVVDVGDVPTARSSADMYSSGIYRQRKVAAGAGGGTDTEADGVGAEARGGGGGGALEEGLLLLLRDMLAVLPDRAAQAVLGAMQAEVLIVLGNHKDAGVRAALVRATAALARRAPPELAKRLKQQHYYIHLANQVSLHPPSWELAAACASLLTKCDVPLEDQLDDDIWIDITDESMIRSPPILALLPICLDDVPLAHNITLIIRRIIEKASLKTLGEVSVAEVVVRAVAAVGGRGDAEFEGRDLLLEDLFELLSRLALKASSAQHSLQTIVELHHMLTYVEWRGEARGEPAVVRVAREAQVALYMAQLDHLEDRLHTSYTAHTKYANYFTTVLSSAVSLGAEAGSRAERTELASRHLSTVVRAVNFLVSQSPRRPAGSEAPLVPRLLHTLLPAVSGAAASRPRWWVGVGMGGGADWASPLQELWAWLAAPAAGARAMQPELLRALYRSPPAALQLLAPQDPASMRKLAVYLLSMLKHIHAESEGGEPLVELPITDWARGWAVGTQAGLPERLPSESLAAEAESLLRADEERWARLAAKQRAAVAKVVFSKDGRASKLTEGAMSTTRQVVDAQNAQRKRFLEQLRRAHSDHVACAQRWARLVRALSHEQAVWHDPLRAPRSWQLDPTEGPGRVRVRLARAHLDIHPRFLLPQHVHKLETVHRGAPLASVVGFGSGVRFGLVARLQLHETVCYMTPVCYVTAAADTRGELLLSDRCIHFIPEDSDKDPETPEEERAADSPSWKRGKGPPPQKSPAQSWALEAVVCVETRRWCLQERAVELFLSSGHAHLIAFADVAERTGFLKALSQCNLPGRKEPDTLAEAMGAWRSGLITNWEYLMRLNGLAGRTYNDLMQYPVLPFVVADYTSRILELEQPASFRDLSRPMAVQRKEREHHYVKIYNDLKAARRVGCSPLSRQPHHYASLYSNSGGVLHYLVRLPPFTQLFLNYQDNNFDMPDRTFHSLATTWRLITRDSPTDVKELIPELFYLPELFHNNEGLNLGVRQCGLGVDDVELPPWAADARLFTLVHRQALEAAHVSEHLPAWLDLVFGYKQVGQPAIDAVNVFPACCYYGFDPTAHSDEVDRTAAEAMVRTYGQAPRQLLRAPHPRRAPDLTPARSHAAQQMPVWAGVAGARWGRYCGSPALGPPAVVARRAVPGAGGLQALPHARSVAVPLANTALQALVGEPPAAGGSGAGAQTGCMALLSWGHSDAIVRLKRRRDARPDLLLAVPALDQITKVTTSCIWSGCPPPIFLGHASGRVLCARLRHDPHAAPAPAPLPARARTAQLHAHSAPVTDMHLCARAGLLATASADGKIVLWDLNDLSYIRTLPNRDMLPVSLVTISPTLCDVATVHAPPAHTPRPHADADADGDFAAEGEGEGEGPAGGGEGAGAEDSDSYEKDATYQYKSLLRVHTVNARFVGSVKVAEGVTSICYSAAPEGVSVNVVACGLRGGGVRLYSSWDLARVALIPPADCALPLLSLTYSSDSSLLFGLYADGVVVAWESEPQGKPAPVRILPAAALC